MQTLMDIPKTLDEVITKNRDIYQISQERDISKLPTIENPPCPAPVKNILLGAKVLKLDLPSGVTYHVVGTSLWIPHINVTSEIIGILLIDEENKYLVKTKNSYYYVYFIDREMDSHDILNICAAFNYWGMSDALGSFKVFY